MTRYTRNATDIRAWTYEADMHCNACATKAFGSGVTEYPWPDQAAVDSEGNRPHPVFESDESDGPEVCGTCGDEIA